MCLLLTITPCQDMVVIGKKGQRSQRDETKRSLSVKWSFVPGKEPSRKSQWEMWLSGRMAGCMGSGRRIRGDCSGNVLHIPANFNEKNNSNDMCKLLTILFTIPFAL